MPTYIRRILGYIRPMNSELVFSLVYSSKIRAPDLVYLLTTAENRPSLAYLSVRCYLFDFRGILLQMQYSLCKFILCFTSEFPVVYAQCDGHAVNLEQQGERCHLSVLLTSLICLDLGWFHMNLAVCLCTAPIMKLWYVLVISTVSERSQPTFTS